MYISELAKAAGASPKAIRMYEAIGLLAAVRRQGAYRAYSDDHLRQVRLIRHAQALGFKLSEMPALFDADGGEPDWARLIHYLDLKRSDIRRECARLQQLDEQLGRIIAEIAGCEAGQAPSNTPHCDLIKT